MLLHFIFTVLIYSVVLSAIRKTRAVYGLSRNRLGGHFVGGERMLVESPMPVNGSYYGLRLS